MSARTIDVLIFALLIPAIPVVALWTLPWERWIAKIPNTIIGPYLLYCAFAIWHFKQPWLIVAWVGLLGIAVSAWAIFDLRKARMLRRAQQTRAKTLQQAQDWPVAEGFIYYAGQDRDTDGVLNVTLRYTYKVHDEAFVGSELFTFSSREDAEQFESRCRGRKLNVHYQKDNPVTCVLDRDGMC